MRVMLHKNNQIKIMLSAVEICDYFGSFDEIRYDNPKARAVLGNLLLEASKDSSFLYDSKKLTIKVIPEEKGGCTIYFTALQKPKRLKRLKGHYIFEFSCCEDMLTACEKLSNHTPSLAFSLYERDGAYRLITETGDLKASVFALLCEFSLRFYQNLLEKQKTQEYWHQICRNTPAKTICGL